MSLHVLRFEMGIKHKKINKVTKYKKQPVTKWDQIVAEIRVEVQ